jgi:hypothetical protein
MWCLSRCWSPERRGLLPFLPASSSENIKKTSYLQSAKLALQLQFVKLFIAVLEKIKNLTTGSKYIHVSDI